MRGLNTRFLILLLLTLVFSCTGTYFLHAYQMERHADIYLREARRARESGHLIEAVNHFRRYIFFAPHDKAGLVEYGTFLEEEGAIEHAYLILGRALRLDAKDDDVRRRVVRLALTIARYADDGAGRLTDAKQHLEEHLLDKSPDGFCEEEQGRRRFDSDDGELLALWGQCLAARRRNPSAAARILEKATVTPPVELSTYKDLADLVFDQLRQPERARQVLDDLVARHGDDDRSYLIRSRWRKDHFELESDRESGLQAIWDDVEQALQLSPTEPDLVAFASEVALLRNDVDRARELIARSLEEFPEQGQLYAAAAQVELRSGDLDAAIEQLERGLLRNREEHELLWNLAVLKVDAGHPEKAEEISQRLRAAGFSKDRLAYLTGRILMSQEQWRAAVRELESVLGSLAPYPELVKQANYYLGVGYQKLHDHEHAQTAFRRAMADDPDWIQARQGLAIAHLESGDLERAVQVYRELVRRPKAPKSAWLGLASLMFQSNLKQPPQQRNWPAVVRILELVEQAGGDTPEVPILLSSVSLVQGDRAQAQKLLADAVAANPDEPRLRAAELDLAIRQREWKRAEELFQQLGDELESAPELRLKKAQYLARRFGVEAADDLEALQAVPADWTEQERMELIERIGRLYAELGELEKAAAAVRVVADARPNDLEPRLLMFDLALRSKNVEFMQQILTEVERIAGQGPLWRYGEAIRLTVLAHESGDAQLYEQAAEHLTQAAIARPLWPRIPALQAEIHLRRGQEDLAIDHYLEAIELGEREPNSYSQVFALLVQHGRFVEADRVLRRLQEFRTPVAPELYRAAAAVSLELNDLDRALVLAQRAVASSNEPQNRIWLGQVYEALGQSEQAEAEFRTAIEMDRANVGGWVSLVRHFAENDDRETAESTIAEAREALDPQAAAVAIAQCYEIIGEGGTAENEYLAALQASPRDAAPMLRIVEFYLRNRRADEAKQWLVKLTSGEIPVQADERHWARRALAGLLGMRGDYQNFLAAMDLIEQNLASPDQSVADRLTKASILASQPRRSARLAAIAILEDVATGHADQFSSSDHFQLASLYFAEGEWSQWRREMVRLLGSQSQQNHQHMAAYAGGLLSRGQTSEAELYIDRLQELAPESLATVDLQLQLWFARKRHADVLHLLSSRIQGFGRPEPSQADGGRRLGELLWAARQLESFAAKLAADNPPESAAFLNSAEQAYRLYESVDPAGASQLAMFHARQGRFDETWQILRTSRSHLTAKHVSEIARTLLAQGGETQSAELRSYVESALQADPTAIPLRIMLADLINRNDPARATRLYRDVLADDPRNVIVLNNLALLLALDEGNTREAAELIQRAIDLAGPLGALLDTRGVIELASARPGRALADIDQALVEGETATRRFHQAQALTVLNRPAEAEEAFRRAVELGLTADRLFPVERKPFQQLERRFSAASL